METIEEEGRTTEEAVERALKRLQVPPGDVQVEVLDEGRKLWGLLGGRTVRVRVSYNASSSRVREAKEALEAILACMDIEATVHGSFDNGLISLKMDGPQGALLIGRHGQTIDALQYIVNRIVNKDAEDKMRVILDTEDYREKRREKIRRLAHRLAARVKNSGQPVTVAPMNSHDRRIIHLALQDDGGVTTVSQGEGIFRKVKIYPKKAGE